MFNFWSNTKSTDKILSSTKKNFWQRLSSIFQFNKRKFDPGLISELEGLLLGLDIGIETSSKILGSVETSLSKIGEVSEEDISKLLQEEALKIIIDPKKINNIYRPCVTLVVGVNGVGKTTTLAKIAAKYKSCGKKVLIGAADTFRAAAVQQLTHWAEKLDIEIVSKPAGADPSSVAYDTVKKGLQNTSDVILIDTAGRLHTKLGLMDELSKVCRTIKKLIPGAPHDVLLVIDGTTGQNAIAQAEIFTKATNVTSLAVTKLDGTAKGGILIAVADKFQLPVRYIGIGEGVEDLEEFDKQSFVTSVFAR